MTRGARSGRIATSSARSSALGSTPETPQPRPASIARSLPVPGPTSSIRAPGLQASYLSSDSRPWTPSYRSAVSRTLVE
jgi:hypothetical protein